ncbi:MAG: hypothetical protein OCC45_11250 [Desulfotalea sp.]
MLVLVEKTKGLKPVEHMLDQSFNLTVTPETTYLVKDAETGAVPDGLVIKRKGDDLLIEVNGEEVASIDGFYGENIESVFSADGSFTPVDAMYVSSGDVADIDIAWEAEATGMPAAAGWALGLVAAGGAGIAVYEGEKSEASIETDGNQPPEVPTAPTRVVFDLTTGTSTGGAGAFDPDVAYDIYIKVKSLDWELNLPPAAKWTGAGYLGADDKITLVGDLNLIAGPEGAQLRGTMSYNSQVEWISRTGLGYGIAVNILNTGEVKRYNGLGIGHARIWDGAVVNMSLLQYSHATTLPV